MVLRDVLVDGLRSIERDRDELAYFALTSKPEFQVRDRLAYRLHRTFHESNKNLRVVREWKRVDLAILEKCQPIALIEAKAMTTYNVTLDAHRERYQAAVRRDLETAAKKAEAAGTRDAEIFALVMVTYVDGEISDELRDVIKYSRLLNKYQPQNNPEQIDKALRNFLPETGPPERVSLGKGNAFGVAAEVMSWLFGPVVHSSDPPGYARLTR